MPFSLIILFLTNHSLSNEYYTNIITIIIVAYTQTQLSFTHNKSIILFILSAWGGQILITIYQLFIGLGIKEEIPIYGTLKNSGVLSCYLVLHLPLLYYVLFQSSPNCAGHNFSITKNPRIHLNFKTVLFITVTLVVFSVIIIVKSRTAILGLLSTSVFLVLSSKSLLILSYKKKINATAKLLLLTISLTTIGCLAYILLNSKKLSTMGRVMSWHISSLHIKETLWWGTGIGRFTWSYPQWQSDYFKYSSDVPNEYFLSSSESYIILNEYLQIFMTIGLIRIILLSSLFYFFFKLKSIKNPELLNTLKAVQIGLLTCCLTSYPLHVNTILMLNALCFSLAFIISEPLFYFQRLNINIIHNDIFSKLTSASLLLITMIEAPLLFAASRWSKIDDMPLDRPNKKLLYLDLDKKLDRDGKFLTEFGIFLLQDSADCQQACAVLEKARKYFMSALTIEATGYSYWQLKKYPEAIRNYQWLVNYIPNRFGFRYDLLLLLKESGNNEGAKQVAKDILSMPIKITSPKVEMIQNEASKVLSSLTCKENLSKK